MRCLAFTVMVAVAFTLGWHTRIMSILLYLCMLSLYHRNVGSNGGPDALPAILSFYMMLCPCGAAYSLDALRAARKRGTAAEPLIVPWALRLFQMQICLLYFQSCVIKCQGALWLKGTVVHYILFLREFRVFDVEWLAQYPLVINALTHGALLIEFALAFWLWFRPTRRWAILGGVLLHLGIRPILNVPGFGEILVATYMTFLAPDELDALLRFLDPRRLAGPPWAALARRAVVELGRPRRADRRRAPTRAAIRGLSHRRMAVGSIVLVTVRRRYSSRVNCRISSAWPG